MGLANISVMANECVEMLRAWNGQNVTAKLAWRDVPTVLVFFGPLDGSDDAAHDLDDWTVGIESESRTLGTIQLNLRGYEHVRVAPRKIDGVELPSSIVASGGPVTLTLDVHVEDPG